MNTQELMMDTARLRREEVLRTSRWGRSVRIPRSTSRELETLSLAELAQRVLGG